MTLQRTGLSLQRDGSAPADIHLDDAGNLVMVRDTQAVGQHIRQRLMTYEGEWFLDSASGVTWLTDILGFQYDPVIAESLIKTEILETDGVVDIDSFSVRFNRELRQLESYDVYVTTEYDEGVKI